MGNGFSMASAQLIYMSKERQQHSTKIKNINEPRYNNLPLSDPEIEITSQKMVIHNN